jgi:hypothetical protein
MHRYGRLLILDIMGEKERRDASVEAEFILDSLEDGTSFTLVFLHFHEHGGC